MLLKAQGLGFHLCRELPSKPGVHACFQCVQRNCTGAQQMIVKRSYVKGIAQCQFSGLSEFQHLQLPNFIGERLPRPAYVAVNFIHNIGFCFSRIGQEKIDGTLATPAEVVDAGIDNQSHGTPHVVNQLSVA